MKIIKIANVLLILLILTTIVIASETQLGDKVYTLNFPKNDYYYTLYSSTIYIQVQNYSGMYLTSATTNCYLQIYNATGSIFNSSYMLFSAPYNFYYVLPSSITSNAGVYPYDVYCNSSTAGGFVSSTFKIGESSPYNSNASLSFAIILMILILVLVYLTVYFTSINHPLTYALILLLFAFSDIISYIGMMIIRPNNYPFYIAAVWIFRIFLIFTFLMFIYVMVDATQRLFARNESKEMKKEFAQYGYNYKKGK